MDGKNLVFFVETPEPATGLAVDAAGTISILAEGKGLALQVPPGQLVRIATKLLQIANGMAPAPAPVGEGTGPSHLLLDLKAASSA
ncbi:hypothetical protein [Geminicoccus flavidas]|uniref:hypothetical protein n=1 Tax=Geminicoccus flavidas TaxID=2506407 RepID=UPI00135C2B8A|nr:hypothetical protein [Geminicoccus flavidas]